MSDVFMSYSREDRDRAELLAGRLTQCGLSVWWDRKILAGNTFDETIQKALDQARCVLVLWSRTSVKSDWVKEEAGVGEGREILVPVLIDDVPIPLGFGRIQTARLVGWNGDAAASELQELVHSIEATIARAKGQVGAEWEKSQSLPARPAPVVAAVAETAAARPRRGLGWIGLALVSGVLATGIFLYHKGVGGPPAPDPAELGRRASLQLDELGLLWNDPRAGDAEVLEACEQLWEQSREHLSAEQRTETTKMIGGLRESRAELERLQSMDTQGKLPIAKRLERWRVFQPARRMGPTGALVAARIDELEAELAQEEKKPILQPAEVRPAEVRPTEVRPAEVQPAEVRPTEVQPAEVRPAEVPAETAAAARLISPTRFVTCRDVRKNTGKEVNPEGIAEQFPPGQVVAFAWVKVARTKERLTFEWIGVDGKVLDRQHVEVGQGAAVRVYRMAKYDRPGRAQVRLYNGDGERIGQVKFQIVR